MAKFTITLKDPDSELHEIISDVSDQKGIDAGKLHAFVTKYIGDGEYVTLQFDTEAQTCKVLVSGDSGENDWKAAKDVVAKINFSRFAEVDPARQSADLQRQLDEALDALEKEKDRATPYSMNLIRFIMETRQALRLHAE